MTFICTGEPNEAFFCQCIPTGQRIAWVTRVVRDCTRKKEQQFGTPHIASALNIAISCSLGSRPINQPKTTVPGHYVSTMIPSFSFLFSYASKSIWIKCNINFNRKYLAILKSKRYEIDPILTLCTMKSSYFSPKLFREIITKELIIFNWNYMKIHCPKPNYDKL